MIHNADRTGEPASQLAQRIVIMIAIDFSLEAPKVWADLDDSRRHRRQRALPVGGATAGWAMTRAVRDDAKAQAAQRWPSLMAAAQEGDRAAYEKWLRECVPVIRSVGRGQGVRAALLDDVVQEVLLTVHRARQTYDPTRSFVAWLSTITQRRAIDARRRQGRWERREGDAPAAYEAHANADAGPAQQWELTDRARVLDAAVAELSPSQREAVEQLALRELSLTEASAVTGRTTGALKVNLHRALKTLYSRLHHRDQDDA